MPAEYGRKQATTRPGLIVRVGERRQDLFERANEWWQILGDDLPDDVFIHAEVVVNDLVAHAYDLAPRDLGMSIAEFTGHASAGWRTSCRLSRTGTSTGWTCRR